MEWRWRLKKINAPSRAKFCETNKMSCTKFCLKTILGVNNKALNLVGRNPDANVKRVSLEKLQEGREEL